MTSSIDGFEARTYESPTGSLLYRIHIPNGLEEGQKCRLVIFFHGAGERGDDNISQLRHGVEQLHAYSNEIDQPTIIVAPQCPNEKRWVEVHWGDDSHTMPEKPSESMDLAMELIADVIASNSVDPKRICVTGISMGGFGTWDIIQREPGLFACAMPVCGGGDTGQAAQLTKLPLWVTHGDSDTVVKTSRSRDMVAAINEAGGEPIYTEFEDVQHDAWTPTYSSRDMLCWLFSQSK